MVTIRLLLNTETRRTAAKSQMRCSILAFQRVFADKPLLVQRSVFWLLSQRRGVYLAPPFDAIVNECNGVPHPPHDSDCSGRPT